MPSHHAHVRTRGTVSIPCSAQRSCAKLLTQYSRLLAARQGSFYAPTVISGATTDMKIFREETFGPAIPLFKFAQDEEAVQLANNTEYGLAAYFFTKVSTPNLLALPLFSDSQGRPAVQLANIAKLGLGSPLVHQGERSRPAGINMFSHDQGKAGCAADRANCAPLPSSPEGADAHFRREKSAAG